MPKRPRIIPISGETGEGIYSGPMPDRVLEWEASGLTLLADGIYWQDGDATALLPIAGQGWNLTTNLNDGLVGDFTTRENSASNTLTWIHVHAASPFTIAEWAVSAKWIDGITETFFEFDGAAWDEVVISSGGASDHVAYTDENWTPILEGILNSSVHMGRLVTTGASVMSISDSRPSA